MAEYTVTNQSLVTITGTAEEDRLIYIYNAPTNDVWLLGIGPAPEGDATPVAGGYSGSFNGMGSNDCPFSGIEHFTFVDESGGNDWIVSGDGNDELNGGAGNDTLYGNGGIDVVDGGTGNDAWQVDMHWATQAIRINLNGASTFLGSGSAVNVEGVDVKTGSGRDVVTGHSSSRMNDTIATNGGNDTIKLWMGGTDSVDAGAGSDLLTVIYNIETNDVWTVSFEGSLATGYSGAFNGLGANDLAFAGVERFSFTDLSGGNDSIVSGGGNDTLRGGAGDDVLRGGGGRDVIDGGAGNDLWGGNTSFSGDAVVINLNGVSSYLGTGVVRGIEALDLTTGAGSDEITGHASAVMNDLIRTGGGNDRVRIDVAGTDRVEGGAGSDVLIVVYDEPTNDVWLTNISPSPNGGFSGLFNGMGSNDLEFHSIERLSFTDLSGGNDIITTGDGADTLNGGAGNDTLFGAGGADRIDGGTGSDRVTGGGGADLFVYGGGMDVITDFSAGAGVGDRLRTAGWGAVDTWAEVQAALVSDGAGGSILVIEDDVNEVRFLGDGVGAFDQNDFLFI
jgi:Ca2+-binding RTX toxin-like protein